MNKGVKSAGPAPQPPKQWGFSDAELATQPIVFRDGLLQDQVFLVSGGGSGIGRAITYMLARLGANVVICGRREDATRAAAFSGGRHCGAAAFHERLEPRHDVDDPAAEILRLR